MPKASSWTRRLTGFSIPWFGVSWQPTPSERDVARELLAQFEDRRVLYNPSDAEVADHCVRSIIEIRHLLTDALVKLGRDGALADHIRALGAACRKFLDRAGGYDDAGYAAVRSHGHYLSWEFLDALGQLRGVFGVHIAMIAARYDLKVLGDLRAVLPAEPSSDDFGPYDGRDRKLRRGLR
jgi:hypothetical protein